MADTTILATAYRISLQEGLRGLWKGAMPRCLYNGDGGMVMFGMYEAARQLLFEPTAGVL